MNRQQRFWPGPVEYTLAVANSNTPFLFAYRFGRRGFVSRFALASSLPAASPNRVAWPSDGRYVGVTYSSTPFVSVYRFGASGFGEKVADPATLPAGTGTGIAWSPDGRYVAVSHNTSPRLSVYAWSDGFGAKVADPASLPAGNGSLPCWSPAGDYLALGHSTTPFLSVYPWADGFGARVADPATLPEATVSTLGFSPDGAYLLTGFLGASHSVYAYPFNGSFGSPAEPAGLGTMGSEVAWSPDGTYAGVNQGTSPTVALFYPWSGGAFGTKLANPADFLSGLGRSIQWSPDGRYVALGETGGKFLRVYQWGASGYGQTFRPVLALPSNTIVRIAWRPSRAQG